MFKGVSQCIPTVGVLYFGSFNPFHYSPLPLLSYPPIFSTHPHILYLHIWWYGDHCCSSILFSFPAFPEFCRVVSLLQTCSTYAFVYDHTCFCVYVYLLDVSSMYELTLL
jgi:hypothetical protein